MSGSDYHIHDDPDIEARMTHGRQWFTLCRSMSVEQLEQAILMRVGAQPGSLVWGEREIAMMVLSHRPKLVWS
jgi:hypothetical protein